MPYVFSVIGRPEPLVRIAWMRYQYTVVIHLSMKVFMMVDF